MAHEERNGRTGDRAAVALGLGLLTGVVVGVGLGLLLAPRDGAAFRKKLDARADELKDDASELMTRGRDVMERTRKAAAAGLREARRQAAAPRDPGESDLAGVEGIAERL